MGAYLIPTILAAGGAATAAGPSLYTINKNGRGPNVPPGNPSDHMSTASQYEYLQNYLNPPASFTYDPNTPFPQIQPEAPALKDYLADLTPQALNIGAQPVGGPLISAVPPSTTESSPNDSAPTPTVTASANIDAMAKGVIAGKYGYGADRKKALGENYTAVQERVNEMLRASSGGSSKKASKAKEPSVSENLNKGSGNWMDTLNSLLPLLALAGGAYYMGRR